jgi:hypothetical protein
MKFEVKDNCPINNFEPCKKLDCAWFIKLKGTDPQSGEEFDDWGCAVAFMPVLIIESAMQAKQTGAAVENFRNVMVEQQKEVLELAAQNDKLKMIE